MKQPTENLQQQIKQLQRQRELVNEEFLSSIAYVKPFEEVKKLFNELQKIDAEIKNLKLDVVQH